MDKQEKRIAAIFDNDKVLKVNNKTLQTYLAYLKVNLDLSSELTGIEDFGWEEYYIIGHGSMEEHEKLRKTRPSYLDTYKVIGLNDKTDEKYGILVTVRRVLDRKKFVLPLADLETKNKKHPCYQLLDDYSVWFANWM